MVDFSKISLFSDYFFRFNPEDIDIREMRNEQNMYGIGDGELPRNYSNLSVCEKFEPPRGIYVLTWSMKKSDILDFLYDFTLNSLMGNQTDITECQKKTTTLGILDCYMTESDSSDKKGCPYAADLFIIYIMKLVGINIPSNQEENNEIDYIPTHPQLRTISDIQITSFLYPRSNDQREIEIPDGNSYILFAFTPRDNECSYIHLKPRSSSNKSIIVELNTSRQILLTQDLTREYTLEIMGTNSFDQLLFLIKLEGLEIPEMNAPPPISQKLQ
jgi:hypothetical protein